MLDFIEKAKKVHDGENLDYSESVYVDSKTPIKIIDHDLDENGNEYGEFWQTPCNHLKGQCHPRKRNKRISNTKSMSREEFIERAKKIHSNENLDYSEVVYVNMHTKVKIISHDLDENGYEYGEFWQEPSAHLKGSTHPRIGKKKSGITKRYTTKDFVEKAEAIFGNTRFNFNKVNYINSKTKIEVFCNAIGSNGKPHGYFWAYPDLFLQGKSCPKCGNQLSNYENEVYEFVCGLVGPENVRHNDTTVLSGKELDIYIEKERFAIEYNGLRWHSEKFGKGKTYHLNKTLKCNEQGITLFQIFEDEFINNREIIFDKIRHALDKNYDKKKIGARECCIKKINKDKCETFLNKNHIQGFANATIYLGAYYNDNLVAVMTFKKENNDKYELNRYCTDIGYILQGAGNRLFTYFIKHFGPKEVKSFLDARWMDIRKNNFYQNLGFKFVSWNKPDYCYTNGHGKRIHKFNFRKQKLHRKYGFPMTMTETEMAKELGYDRIWNCGLIKYVWKQEQVVL